MLSVHSYSFIVMFGHFKSRTVKIKFIAQQYMYTCMLESPDFEMPKSGH
jgi:hypothetical protein